ncbi:hypothetical protein DL98DRAFT_652137 [Cadophora sp. DSE1049]|nr:hypothetical protein DL98DRAFT_652137 [Cadophora sp. DSE1049]
MHVAEHQSFLSFPLSDSIHKMANLCFSPSPAELRYLGLSQYETYLLSRLVQTLRLGAYMSMKLSNTDVPLDSSHPGAADCEAYIKSAFSSDMLSDRLFPLRHTGSSMRFILAQRPVPDDASKLTTVKIFQLCVWRTFAFGNKEHLEEVTFKGDKKPDLQKLASTIQMWGNGELKLPVPAYGQLQITKAKIPTMLSSLWELSEEISSKLKSKSSTPTFTALHERLLNKKIPAIPPHGLIAWLLTSDFFEYGLCQPPTIQNLADHMMKSGTSGPKGAIKIVAEETNQPAPATLEELAHVLTRVFAIIESPTENTPTIQQVVADCKDIQGRELTVVDLEHALCKIARQNTRAKAGKGKSRESRAKGRQPKAGARKENMVDDSDAGTDAGGIQIKLTRSKKQEVMAIVGKQQGDRS